MPLDGLIGQCRHPGGDLSVNWNVGDPHFLDGRDERSRLARMTIEETFAFERSQILHDGGLTREPEVVLDLTRTWRESFFALLGLNEIEDAPLTISQHAIWLRGCAKRASSNEHFGALYQPAFAQLRRGRQLKLTFFQQTLPAS